LVLEDDNCEASVLAGELVGIVAHLRNETLGFLCLGDAEEHRAIEDGRKVKERGVMEVDDKRFVFPGATVAGECQHQLSPARVVRLQDETVRLFSSQMLVERCQFHRRRTPWRSATVVKRPSVCIALLGGLGEYGTTLRRK
jgi:hypothetical protein